MRTQGLSAMSQNHSISIGRSPACAISIADDTVSWNHAELVINAKKQLFITDCGSSNGTFLVKKNGDIKQIRQSVIEDQARVRFGSCEFSAQMLFELAKEYLQQKTTTTPKTLAWTRCDCGVVMQEGKPCPGCHKSYQQKG